MDLYLGDCREVLQQLIDKNIQVDSIVTDPPYELGFMGKSWDSTGIANDVEMWRLCLQILKPGGHLLSFGGSRTYHRMASAIEDAGFQIRDQILWLYGSGFPKSLDVSKAIDKKYGAEREVVGDKQPSGMLRNGRTDAEMATQWSDQNRKENYITTPSTDAAKQWSGWGTALKPAHEIIVCAYKPIEITGLIMQLVNEIIKLCQSLSHAKIANLNLKCSPSELEGEFGFAQWLAAKRCNTPEDLFALMDMLPYELGKPLNLSIVLSWLIILVDILKQENMFTIEMKSNLITDLKTLNYLLLKSTQENIIEDAIKQNGTESNAYLVQSIFNGLYAKLRTIPELSAQEPAILKVRGDTLRPNSIPIVLARKPLSEKTVADNVLKHGVGGINIDGCRVGEEVHSYTPRLTKNENLNDDGWSKIGATALPVSVTGRFPANLIHDSSEEVTGAIGSPSRFFYCAKASKSERNKGLEDLPKVSKSHIASKDGGGGGWEKDAHKNPNLPRANYHPTVKPLALMKYLCRLITPPNGIILDPFTGSGTTGIAAKEEGFQFIGIEMQAEYMEIAGARIKAKD